MNSNILWTSLAREDYYIDDLKNEIIILRLYSNKRNPRNLNDEINEPR